MPHPAGIIFSDLDGTFLDRSYYPVLDAARFARATAGWRVVWVSSRTIEEVAHLQQMLGHAEDAIGENGGVCVTRSRAMALALGNAEPLGNAWVTRLASEHRLTETLVRRAFTDEGVPFRMLEDFTPEELARRAHYGVDDAVRAQRRRASVLVSDVDVHDARAIRAVAGLREHGCYVAHGGHWISVVHGATKGTAARTWLAQQGAERPVEAQTVVAIGNSENDEPLLAMADIAFVVRDPVAGYAPSLQAIAGARLLQRAGTEGWLEMLETLSAVAEVRS